MDITTGLFLLLIGIFAGAYGTIVGAGGRLYICSHTANCLSGRVVLPKELRRVLDINEKDPLEIFVEGEKIILQKYSSTGTCAVTGEITSQNIAFGNGNLVLSPEGAKQLLEELEKYIGARI